MFKRRPRSETSQETPAEPPIAEKFADELTDELLGRVATEDPASPDFDPAFGFVEPAPGTDVPGSVGSLLTRLLEHHRTETERLTKEIDTIRDRADDAIARREVVRQHHKTALDIWGAAQDARIAAWAKAPGTTSAVEMPEPRREAAE
jgi:hypothetical protein